VELRLHIGPEDRRIDPRNIAFSEGLLVRLDGFVVYGDKALASSSRREQRDPPLYERLDGWHETFMSRFGLALRELHIVELQNA